MDRVQQAGAIAVRAGAAGPEVLIVRAKKTPADWIFPKGHIEPGETPDDAAIRELREESGVVGTIIGPVGVSAFRSGSEQVEVTYFLVRFTGTAAPSESRPAEWHSFDSARRLLTFADARRLLDAAERALREERR
jgi:8-oxo-dGTP pyrophosphatase MutT (NUDIX family)